MKKYLLPLFILLSVCFHGCKKDATTLNIISGVVLDRYSQQPVPLADVLLLSYSADAAWGSHYITVASTKSDSAGNFSFNYTIKESDYKNYFIKAQKQNYCEPTSADYAKIEGSETVRVLIEPSAYLKLHIIDTLQTPPTDWMQVYYTAGSMIVSVVINGLSNSDTTFMACVDGATGKSFIKGNSMVNIKWSVTKDTSYSKEANVLCPALDTILYEIYY